MTPLVLIPGMMCDARLFAPLMAAVNDRAVMVATITEHDTIEALAAEVLQDAPPTFCLAGLSMGGIVAMEVLRQQGERVERLCLMDTNPLVEAPEVKTAREPQIEKVLRGELAAVMRDEMKPNYLAEGEQRDAILDLCMEMALDLGSAVFVRQSRALQNRPDQTATLARYRRPALILHGEEDRLCPKERHELMHLLMPQARYTIVSGAGHLPVLERPEVVVPLIKECLEFNP